MTIIDAIADALVGDGPPLDELGPATLALFGWCQERYGWGGADVQSGAYLGWRDALRSVAVAIEVMGPLAVAMLSEEWQPQRQVAAGARIADELATRWQTAREAATETEAGHA